jgi:hypothetical protein
VEQTGARKVHGKTHEKTDAYRAASPIMAQTMHAHAGRIVCNRRSIR